MTDAIRPIDTSLMDESTPASVDFFRHVNGGWLDANPVPPEYGSWGSFHEVNERNQTLLHELLDSAAADAEARGARRMVGDYFAAAMDEAAIAEAGTAPLDPYFARIEAIDGVADLGATTRELHRMGVEVLFGLGVAPDFEDSGVYMVYVGQGGLGLPERDYYLRDDERSATLRTAYADHVAAQLANLGESAEQARADADAILAFETRLADASYPAEKMRDVQLTMNRHDVAALDELMPGFALGTYLSELGVTLPTVNIDNPGFFTALDALIADTPAETLRAYLRWHLLRTYASALSPSFEAEAFDFYGRTLGGQQEQRPRWKRMIDAATGDVGELVSQLYVEAAFSPEAKERCEQLVDHLLSAMGRSIAGAEWMTEPTKQQAAAKLARFTYKIGYPDTWRDYSGLVVERGPFVTNRVRAAEFEFDRQIGRLGQPVDTSEWEMPPHLVNAYFHPLLNEIVFPAGILQPPFFYADADDAVNYGAIGAVIGHEITHGFDDRGSHFDEAGGLRDWWTEQDRKEFERRADVLVEQFDGFAITEDQHVNGRLTLGENIADLGGVTISYHALHEAIGDDAPAVDGLTPEQRFFISYASVWRMNYTEETLRLLVNVDPHSPTMFRANGPLSNFPPFAAAFDIPEGSPMVRSGELRAKIW